MSPRRHTRSDVPKGPLRFDCECGRNLLDM
jgi:hypothetical protein